MLRVERNLAHFMHETQTEPRLWKPGRKATGQQEGLTIGIVGCEANRFSIHAGLAARKTIHDIIFSPECGRVVSGACHKGGIDRWAAEIAKQLGCPLTEHKPETLDWPGFRKRNLLIARDSDLLVCITVSRPAHVPYRRCYHCNAEHMVNGGCWTMKEAYKLGKQIRLIVL